MTQRLTIALTGGTGFLGRHIAHYLHARGHHVRLLLRSPSSFFADADSVVIGDIAKPFNMGKALEGVDVVVHSAGIAHVQSGCPDEDYRLINTDATLNLAAHAKRAGARKFVFLSSIRAQSGPWADHILTEKDNPQPTDAYGRSKYDAEMGLANMDMDWVALRPVVIYGHGAVGNIAGLLKLAASPWPLPLGGFTAKRSLVSAQSVASAIEFILHQPQTLQRAFIVSDPDPLTASEMISALRAGMNRKPGIVYVPEFMIAAAARLSGQDDKINRLRRPLVADSSALQACGWQPAFSTRDGLKALARKFVANRDVSL